MVFKQTDSNYCIQRRSLTLVNVTSAGVAKEKVGSMIGGGKKKEQKGAGGTVVFFNSDLNRSSWKVPRLVNL